MLEYVEERLRSLVASERECGTRGPDLSHGYFVIIFHQEEDMMDEGMDRSTISNQPKYLVL